MQLFTLWVGLSTHTVMAEPTPSIYDFDEIVVVFEESIITRSDLQKDKILIEKLPIASALLQNVRSENPLEGLIHIELIKHTASDTMLYQAKEVDVQQRHTQFIHQWSSPKDYQEFLEKNHLTEQYIQNLIQNHILAEQYIYRNLGIKLESLLIDDVQSYHDWVLKSKEAYSIRYIRNQ